MIRLEKPNIEFKESFIKAVKEVQEYDEVNDSTNWYKKLDVEELENNFGAYVRKIRSQEQGENLGFGHVPSTMFWMIDENNEYVGRISLRHELTEFLKSYGGHIGYDVIPSSRKNGYAKEALKLCLKEAKAMGIKKVLLTCFKKNIASSKVIKNNGGIYEGEDIVEGHEDDLSMRYWIKLK